MADNFSPVEAAAAITKNPPVEEKTKPVDMGAANIKHKKPPVPVANKQASSGFPAPGSDYWKKHPLITEHSDGTVRPWGDDTTALKNPNVLPKQMLPPTLNNQQGYSGGSGYNVVDGNRTTKTPDALHKNNQ